MPEVLDELLAGRKFGFAVERAIFLTVLHRLMASAAAGTSDRAAEKWRAGPPHPRRGGPGASAPLPGDGLAGGGTGRRRSRRGATPFSPRCTKDLIEEALFARRRDLFTGLSLAFFDTTSLYFEGEGGESLGQYGHSKDHRPDLKQMVVGMVLSGEGRPVCCEMWPGNTTDVKTLLPVVERLRQRFGITQVCVVADRGMISDADDRGVGGRVSRPEVHPGGAAAERSRGAGHGAVLAGGATRRCMARGSTARTPRR